MVVYDPDDPHMDLYDIDDGQLLLFTFAPPCLY